MPHPAPDADLDAAVLALVRAAAPAAPRAAGVRRQLPAPLRGTALRDVERSLRRLERGGRVHRAAGRAWSASPPRVHTPKRPRAAADDAPAADDTRAPGSTTSRGRWAAFRRICAYQAECIHLEESGSVTAWGDDEGQRYVWLPGSLDWAAIGRGEGFSLGWERAGDLAHALNSRRGKPGVWLGTPAAVTAGTSGGEPWERVEPALLQPLDAEVHPDRLVLHPAGPVRVNAGWLKRHIKKTHEQQHALELLGLGDGQEPASLREAFQRLGQHHHRLLAGGLRWGRFEASAPEPDRRARAANAAVLLVQPVLKYAGRVHGELLQLADPTQVSDEQLDGTALAAVFPHDPPPRRAGCDAAGPADPVELNVDPLDGDQRAAARAAAAAPLTVVQGPPGTGKSRVVRHLLAEAAANGRPALLASKNHEALAAVVPALQRWGRGHPLLLNLARRHGSPEDANSLREALAELAASSGVGPGAAAARDARLGELAAARRRSAEAAETLERIAAAEDGLAAALRDREAALGALPPSRRAALEAPGFRAEPLAEVAAARRRLDRLGWPLRTLAYRLFQRRAVAGVLHRAAAALNEPAPPTPDAPADAAAALGDLAPAADAARAGAAADHAREQLLKLPAREPALRSAAEADAAVASASGDALAAVAAALGAAAQGEERQTLHLLASEARNLEGADATAAHRKLSRQVAHGKARGIPPHAAPSSSGAKWRASGSGRSTSRGASRACGWKPRPPTGKASAAAGRSGGPPGTWPRSPKRSAPSPPPWR